MAQKLYISFIESLVGDNYILKVPLPVVREISGEVIRARVLVGTTKRVKVNCTVVARYSRSLKIKVDFDNTDSEVLVYCHLGISPQSFFDSLKSKVTNEVWGTYSDEELIELEAKFKNNE